jgi:predicted GNAT family acetyltransferase
MKACHTADPTQFLDKIQSALEQDEAANQVMLVRCCELSESKARSDTASMVWTEDAQGVTAAALLVPPEPMWLFCEPLPKEISLQLLLNMLRDVPFKRVKGKNHVISTFSEQVQRMYGCSVQPVGREKVLKLTRCLVNPFTAGYMRLAVRADADQIIEWMEAANIENKATILNEVSHLAVLDEIAAGNIYVWEDGLKVSMITRTLPTRHGSAISLLYTPPPLRNRGYATALVNAVCAQLFQEGFAYCTLSLDPQNEAAAHIFQRLGFTLVCDLDEIEVRS